MREPRAYFDVAPRSPSDNLGLFAWCVLLRSLPVMLRCFVYLFDVLAAIQGFGAVGGVQKAEAPEFKKPDLKMPFFAGINAKVWM